MQQFGILSKKLSFCRLIKLATQTFPGMAANNTAAVRTLPFISFLCEKLIHAVFFYRPEVFNHAHVVFVTISFIKRLESFAWKINALITKTHETFTYKVTVGFHEQAVFTAGNTTRAIFSVKTLFVEIVDHELI